MNSVPIEQKTLVGKCFIIYANRMIYLSCLNMPNVFCLFFSKSNRIQSTIWPMSRRTYVPNRWRRKEHTHTDFQLDQDQYHEN
jgi:hypothetical protein